MTAFHFLHQFIQSSANILVVEDGKTVYMGKLADMPMKVIRDKHFDYVGDTYRSTITIHITKSSRKEKKHETLASQID